MGRSLSSVTTGGLPDDNTSVGAGGYGTPLDAFIFFNVDDDGSAFRRVNK